MSGRYESPICQNRDLRDYGIFRILPARVFDRQSLIGIHLGGVSGYGEKRELGGRNPENPDSGKTRDRPRVPMRSDKRASKKQTPFSVWYNIASASARENREMPQRSRRLSASGIRSSTLASAAGLVSSKKQTPFSVWYADGVRSLVCEYDASKKQTPFSVWYSGLGERPSAHRIASKKQTPFSVWY